MPKYAVLIQYKVISGLVIDAANEDEAAHIASEFEAKLHEDAADSSIVRVSSRVWGDGTIEVQQAGDDEAADDLLDEWIDDAEEALGEDDEDDDGDGDDESSPTR